jgi:hypothetical protein
MPEETITRVSHLGQLVAIIVRANHPVKNLEFFTEEQHPLQVGMHDKPAGLKLAPHVHLSNTKVITEIDEVLYVVSGKIRTTFYTVDGDKIDEAILGAGDFVIQLSQGHGVDILEDAKIFEVKQGPYPGTQHAKIYLHEEKK